jgi:phosphomannomutase
MSIFKCGERVRVVETAKNIKKTYIIKKIFKSDDGIPLYLLKSETDPTLRLYYESEESGLERIT